MSDSNPSNVIDGMLSIHAVITRGLKVAVETTDALAHQGNPDARLHDGLLVYLRCLVSLLTVHHDTEDTLAFPAFRERLTGPFELLIEQHRILHPMLEEAAAEIDAATATPGASDPLRMLNLTFRRIDELWHPHIAIEQEHFTVDRCAACIPPEEHIRLNALFLEHARRNWGADDLMVPFLLHNLEPDRRSIFAAEMPPVVLEQLVPVVWKERWAPMQPFLLA